MTAIQISDLEQEVAKTWIKEHEKDCTSISQYPSIHYEIYPGHIACSVYVVCECGTRRNVTDYDSW